MGLTYYFLISNNFVLFLNSEELTLHKDNFFYFTSANPELQKEELNSFLKLKNIEFSENNSVLISYYSGNNILIPSASYDIKHNKSYYNYCFDKLDKNDEIDFNRLFTLSIVNVFSIAKWLKKFWILRFPKVQIKHYASVQIQGISSLTSFDKQIHFSLFKNEIHLVFFNQKKLIFQNSFLYESVEDVVYYLSFCIQQENWINDDKLKIFYYIYDNNLVETFELIKIKCMSFKVFNSAIWNESGINHFKFLQNCVS